MVTAILGLISSSALPQPAKLSLLLTLVSSHHVHTDARVVFAKLLCQGGNHAIQSYQPQDQCELIDMTAL